MATEATSYDFSTLSDLQQVALDPSSDISRYNMEFGKTKFGKNDLRLVKAELLSIAKLWNVVVPKSMTTKLLRSELLQLAGLKTSTGGAKAPRKATKVARRQKVTNDSIRNSAPELVDPKVNQRMDSLESTVKQLAASMELLATSVAAIAAASK